MTVQRALPFRFFGIARARGVKEKHRGGNESRVSEKAFLPEIMRNEGEYRHRYRAADGQQRIHEIIQSDAVVGGCEIIGAAG